MTTAIQSTEELRAEYIAGLRELADALEAHPNLKLPVDGEQWMPLSVYVTSSESQRESLAEWARVLPGKKIKKAAGSDKELLALRGALRGLWIEVVADRDEVCERVVTGTREVTEEVPDPQALAAVPKVTVTKTVEDVEWVCKPLLAEAPAEPVVVK